MLTDGDESEVTTAASPHRSSLLTLPPEIRVEIFRHLFLNSQILADGSCSMNGYRCGTKICRCSFPHQLLVSCRQLRWEANSYLLAATTLQISGAMKQLVSNVPQAVLSAIPRVVISDARRSLSKLPLQFDMFDSLKILELRNITIWCQYHDEEYLKSLAGDECMMGLAWFNLNRISPQLTHLCADKHRSFRILLCCQFVASSMTGETIVSLEGAGTHRVSFLNPH